MFHILEGCAGSAIVCRLDYMAHCIDHTACNFCWRFKRDREQKQCSQKTILRYISSCATARPYCYVLLSWIALVQRSVGVSAT